MLSGALQGKFLEMISRLIRPAYILEIGTFLGYSALCLEKGLRPEANCIPCEVIEETAATAGKTLRNLKQVNKIILHTGNALELLGTLISHGI